MGTSVSEICVEVKERKKRNSFDEEAKEEVMGLEDEAITLNS